MIITLHIDEEKDGPDAARQALAGRDFVMALDQAFAEIRSKLKYGPTFDGTDEEHEAFVAGIDFARTALIDALEGRSLLDLVLE